MVIYFEVDCEMLVVFLVDEVYCVGLVLLSESYLCGEVIVELVKKIGVDVIYLGYGFFLENVDFVW